MSENELMSRFQEVMTILIYNFLKTIKLVDKGILHPDLGDNINFMDFFYNTNRPRNIDLVMF